MSREPEAQIYAEHAPDPELARYVECYWTVSCRLSTTERQPGRVLPDGCMDILFRLADASGPSSGSRARASAIGSMTRAIEVDYAGRVELVGVRFRPGGATPWLDLPAAELTDQVIGLEELWGDDAERAFERLSETRAGERIALLDEVLLTRLRRHADAADRVDERVLRAAEAVEAARGAVRVEQLAEATGLGRRQLERRFLACVGLPPKTASRIARFREVVARMHADPASELARLALDAGYADQAHMNRDFRALAGVTPGAYLAGLGDA